MTLADSSARDAIRNELDTTLVVEAAAGSGKTTELVRRVVALVESGRAKLSTLVAVTFTEKAAGEMKLRLRTAIERARARHDEADPIRRRLDLAIRELEVAHIGTIHSFCAEILRERPIEAGIDPLFVVCDEGEARRLYGESFDTWFQGVLAEPKESFPGVHRVLRRRSRDEGPREALFDAGYRLVDQRDFDAPWTRPTLDRDGRVAALLADLRELGALALRADDKRSDPNDAAWVYLSLDAIRRFVADVDRKEATRGGERDLDGLEAELRALSRERLWGWKGFGRLFEKASGLTREDVIARRTAVKAKLDAYLVDADADLAALLREELRPLVDAYESRKREAGKLDFLDLLTKTRDLLRRREDVRRDLRARYTHVLVDEFQDTDPLQAEILRTLGRAPGDDEGAKVVPGKLFFVGDPKQSIYRFRRADVAFYEAEKRALVAEGAKVVHLTTSFRATCDIQSVVNAAFAPVMRATVDGSQAEYVPLAPYRTDATIEPSVVALPVPKPYSDKIGKVTSYAVEDSLPDAVGAFVSWLVTTSGYTVPATEAERREGKGPRVPIRPDHVCLLFKRFSSFGGDTTRPYVRALEARRVPHVLVGGRGFFEREEVLALRNASNCIEFPFDEMATYATLRGPLFALTDSAIFGYRSAARTLDSRKVGSVTALDEHAQPVAEALAVLRDLHRTRNRRPFADTLAELLERTRAHAGFAIWPTGEQALANVLRMLDLARRATHAAGVHSFRAFVDKLERDADRGQVSEAMVVEEDASGVRMMTVHRAKGLEFPVVVLVDPTARATHSEPSRLVDGEKRLFAAPLCGASPLELSRERDRILRHDAEEALRLLYVATTRAKDMLVVPIVGDGPLDESWLSPLWPALHPARPGSPLDRPTPVPFGSDSVVHRPEKARVVSTVRPGWHTPKAGSHPVLVFDPHALELGKDDEAGLRQQKLLAADERGLSDESRARHEAWVARREKTRRDGARPSVRVVTPTELKEQLASSPSEVPVEVAEVPRSRIARPHGKRFGVLVHALLAEVPLGETYEDESLPLLARSFARGLGATVDEVDAAIETARTALGHDVFRRALRSGDVRREVTVTQTRADGSLLEGVVDLVFLDEDGTYVVVDYKTDLDVTPRLASYEAQVALYGAAIRDATGREVRGVVLVV